jgi:hypothetical protein
MTPPPQRDLELPGQVFKTSFQGKFSRQISKTSGMFGARFFAAILFRFLTTSLQFARPVARSVRPEGTF